jgi:hypothetical protein
MVGGSSVLSVAWRLSSMIILGINYSILLSVRSRAEMLCRDLIICVPYLWLAPVVEGWQTTVATQMKEEAHMFLRI